jgi:hypothetical protein
MDAELKPNDLDRKAAAQTNRLSRELDITNADHIALWIEANTIPDEPMNQCASWLACRIVEAHEAKLATAERDALERAAVIADGRANALAGLDGELFDAQKREARCIAFFIRAAKEQGNG